MLLACNYYEETERLAREGRIAVDCFKYPSLGFQMKTFDDPALVEYGEMAARVRELGPLLLHGLGQRDNDIGRADFKERFDTAFTRRIAPVRRGYSAAGRGAETHHSGSYPVSAGRTGGAGVFVPGKCGR